MSSPHWKTHSGVGASTCSRTCVEAGPGAFPCIVKVWPSTIAPGAPVSRWPSRCESLSPGPTDGQNDSQEGCSSLSTACLESAGDTTDYDREQLASPSTAIETSTSGLPLPLRDNRLNAVRKPTSRLSAALRAQTHCKSDGGPSLSSTDPSRPTKEPSAQLAAAATTATESALAADAVLSRRPLGELPLQLPVTGTTEPEPHGPAASALAAANRSAQAPRLPPIKSGLSAGPAAAEGDDGGAGSVVGSVSEAWDSLPCFSPSLVDRLWAGRASTGSDTPPQLGQWRLRDGVQRKRSHHGQHSSKPLLPRHKDPFAREGSGSVMECAGTSAAIVQPERLLGAAPRRHSSACAASDAHVQEVSQVADFCLVSCTAGVVPPRPGLLTCQVQATRATACGHVCNGARACNQVPCMALVEAAAAAAPAPRALGSACRVGRAGPSSAVGDSSHPREEATDGPEREKHAVRARSTAGAVAPLAVSACPKATAAAPATDGAAAPVRHPDTATATLAADALDLAAPSDGGAPPAAPAAVLDFELGCPRLVAGFRTAAAAADSHPTAMAGGASGRVVESDYALLAAMARQAFSEPRGHVHNGPRMPYCCSPTGPRPAQPQSVTAGPAVSRGGSSGTDEAQAFGDGGGQAAPGRQGGGGPRVGHWCPESPPDSPLSQASTVWEHPQAAGSYVMREVRRTQWPVAGSSGSRQGSLGGVAGGGGGGVRGCDARTRWWNLTGRFCEAEDVELRRLLFPHVWGFARPEQRQPWWRRWLLAR